MKKIVHGFLILSFLSISILFFIFLLGQSSIITSIGSLVNDTFTFRIPYEQNKHEGNIVIVKIDTKSLQSLGQSDINILAFDKGAYADLIEKLFSQYNIAALGIDIIFGNPSVLGKEDEQKLATTLEKYKKQIVIATRSDYNPHPLCLYSGVQQAVTDLQFTNPVRTFPLSDFLYDLTGYCPDTSIYEGNQGKISNFPREVLDMYVANTNPFEKEKIVKNLSLFDAQKKDTAYIDFYFDGKKHDGTIGYESYSFLDIYNGLTKTSDGKDIDLKGKLILLGEVGTTLQDSKLTPVYRNIPMAGVEINANIITTLEKGRVIQDLSVLWTGFLFFLMFLIIVASVIHLRIIWAIGILGCSLSFLIVLGAGMYVNGFLLNIFLGIVGCFLSFAVAYMYRFQVTDKAKRKLKKQFSLYVSPDVVNEIMKNSDTFSIKGEKREMSIFFSDIVSFTSLSETIQPELLVEILNEYFSEMTHIIHKNKGTLDKYIGDAVMCFFNAPLLQENHSFYACKTALEQQKRLQELNMIWQSKGYPDIKIRIGIHSGEAVHGNIGSSDTRLNYTVIGDSVNLASRLEGICKEYAIHICVSESVFLLQKDAFHFRELDVIAVKGKKEPVRIYELIGGKKSQIPEQYQIYFNKYAEALTLYRQEDYRGAGKIWLENRNDPPSFCMAQRCRDILDGKAHVEQGVFTMTHK